jgi:Ni/Fe-hydrogenase subunit HybB-like protein
MAFKTISSSNPASPDTVAGFPQPAKPPPWRMLIMIDLYCAELAAGLFITAALAELIAADIYQTTARIGYIAAFPIAFIDLLCLVFDLGDPVRFHHMLRVFKLRSPMSVGTWAVSAFSLLSFVCFVLALINIPGFETVRAIIGAIGLPVALFVGGYKGVMLSCTAQPIWKAARWLGAELVSSAALMGIAALLLVAVFLPARSALSGLRLAQLVMLCLNLGFTLIFGVETFPFMVGEGQRRELFTFAGLVVAGWIVPLLLIVLGAIPELITSACLILAAGLVYRHELVMYPYLFGPSST